MALVISISGYVPPANVPLTMAAMRKMAAGFAVSISGTVGSGEIVDGSVSPAKVSPGAYFYGVATFASDVYTVTLSPPLTGLSDGVKILVKVNNANTATEAALVVNGLPSAVGAPIRKRLNTKLLAGELMAGSIVEFTYNSSGTAHWEANTPALFERQTYAITTGTVASNRCSAFVLSLDWEYGDVSQWTNRVFFARAHADCNATPTVKVGTAATAKTLKWLDGQPLSQSQIRKGQLFGFVYDSGADAFLVIGEQPSGVFGTVETSGSASAWECSIPGFPESPVAGLMISIKVVNHNTAGAVTLAVTSPISGTVHSAKAVTKHYNRPLDAFDVINNSYVVLVYDGTRYQLQSPTCQPIIMAMAQFDGTLPNGTITPRRYYNLHATNLVTKHGTGDYTLNFATALPSVNYLVHVGIGSNTAFGAGGVSVQGQAFDPATYQLVGSVRIHTGSTAAGTAGNAEYIYVTVIGFPNF